MNDIVKRLMEWLNDRVPKMVRDLFARGDGITYITQLGTITADYVSGLPQVKLDRNDAASAKGYRYISPYVPAANDRVALLKIGREWVVLGKVVNS